MFFIARLKAAFRQGEDAKRTKVLEAIMESVHESYSESNYYTNFYWVVEQLLMSDPEFHRIARSIDTECLKQGLSHIVDSATARVIKLTE